MFNSKVFLNANSITLFYDIKVRKKKNVINYFLTIKILPPKDELADTHQSASTVGGVLLTEYHGWRYIV